MTEAFDEQARRKAYVRRRQTLVFTVVAITLAATLIVASMFAFHIFGWGKRNTPATKPNYGVSAPCAPQGQDGSQPAYANNASISIRVLNGTTFSGFARAVGEALQNRNFNVTSVGNNNASLTERTTIVFGRNAIPEAYTLAGNFTDAILRMDDRQDKLIDVVLGASFENLRDKKDAPAAGGRIADIKGCVAADQMKNLPKAPEHTAV